MNYDEVRTAGLTHDGLGNPLIAWCPIPCRMERPHYHSLILCPLCDGEARACLHAEAWPRVTEESAHMMGVVR